jgi:DNA-binding transcriptional LysR family regulator
MTSTERRNALTPEALSMVDAIARSGSFAAAARQMGKVPSALTYSVRQLVDALDVLLFDRSSRQAKLTAAGEALLEHGRRVLGEVPFVFAVAPHHPLAAQPEPLADEEIQRHRAVAVADSAQRLAPATHNLLGGQDVLTVSSMQAKVEAQLRCLGCGFLPEPLARPHIRNGVLVVKRLRRGDPRAQMGYAWRADALGDPRKAPQGLALRWWLSQLESPATRQALLERHREPMADVD